MNSKHILITLIITLVAVSTFKVNAQPQIVSNGPLEFCSDASVTLCVEPATYSSYLWSNGNTTPCITVTESGDYFPVMLDSNGNIDSSLVSSPATVIVHNPEPLIELYADCLLVLNATEFTDFQWYFLDTLVENATQSYFVLQGLSNPCCTYVVVTDSFGCSTSSYCVDFGYENCITSVGELIGDPLNVYPNPTSKHIIVESSGNHIETVTLIDMLGRRLGRFPTNGNQRVELDLSNYTDGLYMVEVILNDGRRGVQRLVVQH